MKPTDSDEEMKQGRIALWLNPEDIEFLSNEWRKIPTEAPASVLETWQRIAFRASTALHKNGLNVEPKFPLPHEIYKI